MSNSLCTTTSETPVQRTEPATRRPYYQIENQDTGYEVRVYLPGVNRKGVEINLHDDTLTIDGRRSLETPDNWRALSRELPEADFRLQLQLNVPLNADKISAKVENGVLRLTLPKADEVLPRAITIE